MKRLLLLLPLLPLLGSVPAAHAVELPGVCALRSVSYGAPPTTGSVNVAGDLGCFRFTGDAGDVVRVRLIRTSGTLEPLIGVVRPDRTTHCAPNPNDQFLCRLTVAGVHTMTVADAAGTATGTYALSIQRINDPVGCATIAYGPAAHADVLAAGEAGCWRFTGTAGDQVRTRVVTASSTLAPQVAVEQGGRESCRPDPQTPATCRLRRTGTHTLFVTDSAGTGSGDYALSIQRLNDPVGCATLSVGADATAGAIATGETDCYRLAGWAGDLLRVRLIAAAGALDPSVEVVAPGGSRLCPPSTADDSRCELTDGLHTLLIGDAVPGTRTGDYRIAVRLLDGFGGCSQLTVGALPRTVTLTGTLETDCWDVRAEAGDRLRVRVLTTAGTLNPVAEVLRPDGRTQCAPTPADESTCALTATGTQRILVSDFSGMNSGEYVIAIQRLNDPVGCRTLAFATLPDSAAITTKEADCFRFDAAGGDRVRVGAIAFAGTGVLAEVLRPDGTTRCGPARLHSTCAVDQTGRHTILVVSDTRVATSSYGILVQRLNDPVGCRSFPLGSSPIAASITAAVETDCYRLDGIAGDAARLAFIGTLQPHVLVLRPDGSTRCEARAPLGVLGFSCPAFDVDGPHTILVEDDLGTRAGAYTVATKNVTHCAGTRLSRDGGDQQGSISQPGELDCWGFEASPGERMQVRLTRDGGALDPVAVLLRLDGSTLCGPVVADEFVCEIDVEGLQRFLIGGTAAGRTGDYEISMRPLS